MSVFQKSLELRQQLRKRLLDRVPDDVQIDIEIGMDEPISRIDDRAPRDLRVGISQLRADPRRGFPLDLEIPHKQVLQRAI